MNNKIKSDIARVRKLEVKAQKLQQQMNVVRRNWEKEVEKVRHTKEWSDDCVYYNVIESYNFYDLLA